MEVGVVTSFISSVGFPIFCCVGMAYFITSTMKEFTTIVRENTMALEKLLMKLDNDERGE